MKSAHRSLLASAFSPALPVRNCRRGFTLLELLAVLALTVVLTALLLPVLNKITATSQSSQCASNLHQLGVAAMLYGSDNTGNLPIGRADSSGGLPDGSLVWYDGMALYMGRSNRFVAGNPVSLPAVFACPSNRAPHLAAKPPTADPAWPAWPYTGDYGYNSFLNAYPSIFGVTKFSQLAHPSQTLMVSEVAYQNEYGQITAYPQGQCVLGARHFGADNLLWADGHVSRMTYAELKAMATDVNTPWKGSQLAFYMGVDQ